MCVPEATVLLVDDDAVQAATRQAILSRAGYHVIAALDPARALEQFRLNTFSFDIRLVITDHVMAAMSGAEFVRELRTMRPCLPVLVVSGMPDAEAEYQGLEVEFRVKPLMPDLLLQYVHRLAHEPLRGTLSL